MGDLLYFHNTYNRDYKHIRSHYIKLDAQIITDINGSVFLNYHMNSSFRKLE